MRRAPSFTLALAMPALVVALPVLSRPAPRPHAVRPSVQEIAVGGVDAAAGRALREPGPGGVGPVRSRVAVLTAQLPTRSFAVVGVTWVEDRGLGELEVTLRTRSGGRWGAWQDLDADDEHGPDLGTPDVVAHRGGSSPLWVGEADGVQVRVGVADGAAPRDVRIALVDPGRSDADRTLGVTTPLGGAASSASASTGRPTIISRAQWGADESLRSGRPDYASTLKMGFVHHTVTSNSYTSAQAAAMVRGVYAYHTRSRGWSDIGYNFLVDKYGRIYEGRAGGVDRPVIGAHTSGFNTATFGVSLLGTYSSVAPSAAQLTGLQKILAWRLQAYHRDPTGTTLMTSAGGPRYAKGTVVRLSTISGHRDGGETACPGYQTYVRLPKIRTAVRTVMGSNLVNPVVTGTAPLYRSGEKLAFTSGLLRNMSWRWRFTSVETGDRVRTIIERNRVSSVSGSWDLRDDSGALVPPGRYLGRLDAWTWDGNHSVPFTTEITVRSPLTSGLVVSGPDGMARLLTGRYHERMPRPLRDVLFGAAALPVRPYQHGPFAVAPARLGDGAYFRTPAGSAYVVTGGVRRQVPAATATALGLPTAPPVLPDAVWQQITPGVDLTDASRHPDGMLVTDGTATWRLEQGARRRLVSPAARASWEKGRARATALAGDLALPEAAGLGPAEGTLLRTANGNALLVSGGTLRPISTSVASALGYAIASAPLATEADVASLPGGVPVTDTARHPAGALVRSSTGHWQIDGDRRRPVHESLVVHDSRKALVAKPGDLALVLAAWTAPEGVAAAGADGSVNLVTGGRVVKLSAQDAEALGYEGLSLPPLSRAALGDVPDAPVLTTDSHPSGSLVRSAEGTWLLEGGVRRPVTPGVLATYRGRVVVPATATDLAVPVAAAAAPPHGTLLRSDNGSRWVVDHGRRRWISPVVSSRLGLEPMPWLFVPASELSGTPTGPPVV